MLVRAGAETRLTQARPFPFSSLSPLITPAQLSASLLQRLQLAEAPWEESLRFGANAFSRPLAMPAPPPRPRPPRDAPAQVPPREGLRRVRRETEEDDTSAAVGGDAEVPPSSRGIPLVRPSLPSERRDADGGYGSAAGEMPPFDQWAEGDPEKKEWETVEQRRGARGPVSREDFI